MSLFQKDRNRSRFPSGRFTLVVFPPLQCSASCGQGYRQRLISCSEVHVESENYQYGHPSLSNCPGTPPESYMPCHLDPCPSPQAWQVGIWGPVSEPLISIQRFWLRMGWNGLITVLDVVPNEVHVWFGMFLNGCCVGSAVFSQLW